MKRISFGRLIVCLVLAFAIIRFAGVVASGLTSVTYGDFAATLPGAYAESLNPTLWNSPDLSNSWAFQKQTYIYGPTQFLTLYPIVFLDSYAAIARLLLVVYVGLILLTCWVISKSFDFLSEGDAVSRRLLIYGSTLLFFPLLQALIQREFEVVILLALSLMYWAALRDNRRALGGLIAYITWFKYLPLVVGLPYLIARRWWGAAAAFALTSVVMLGLSELLFGMSLFFNNLGPELAREPFTALRSSTAFCADWSPIQTTEVNIRWGLCGLKAQGFWVPLPFSYLALIAVTAFVGYVGFWSFEHRDQISLASERWRRVWEISLVVIVYSTFLAGHYYYLSALILPLLALFIRFTSGAAIQKTRLAIAVLAYALLSAFVLPISVLSAVFEVDVWQFYLSHQFYLVGELLLLALVLREYVAPSFKVTGLKAALLPTRRHACGVAFTLVLAVSSLYWSAVLTAPLLESQPAAVIAEQDVADLRVSAEQGSVVAQLDLGNRYEVGRGVARDEVAAMAWYRRAARQPGGGTAVAWFHRMVDQGSAEAQTTLGVLYAEGRGVARDEAAAVGWYQRAAVQGSVAAQVALGVMHETGRGVAEDEAAAMGWYRRAAAQGEVAVVWWYRQAAVREQAEARLSVEGRDADDVSVAQAEAVAWFHQAAERGSTDAQMTLGGLYATGDGVVRDAGEAARWYQQAAEQGQAEAQMTLGGLYAAGNGVAQDVSEAVRWYRRAAEQGLAAAQVTLGEMYATGDGVPRDDAAAVAWYRRAAEQGDAEAVRWIRQTAERGQAEAQVALGGMYFAGQGVAEDAAEGVRWWRLAAEQGHLPAQTGLAGRYFNGRGVTQDAAEAVRWYRMAAEQGDAEVLAWMHLNAEQGVMPAQAGLAEMYAEGRGVTPDVAEAVRWYRAAAEQGHTEAQVTLGHRYDTGEGVVQDEAEAARWYRRAAAQGHAESLGRVHLTAEQGSVEAQASLGEMYAAGEGVPPDAVEAIRWWRLAAEQGHAEAQVTLGHRYDTGEDVAQDAAEAAKWYRLAAEQGHAEAQVTLGVMYEMGRGVARDAGEAVGWYQRAAEQGDVSAQARLADMFAEGRGVPRDEAAAGVWYRRAAAWWFRLAAERGWAAAQATLGEMYAAGEGVPQDDLQAMRWYRRAAEQGSVAAQARLADMFAEGRGVPRDQVQAHTWFNLAAARASGEERARYENARDLIAEQMTSAQIAVAQRRAREWDAAHPREP